jgi:hypothetical protein
MSKKFVVTDLSEKFELYKNYENCAQIIFEGIIINNICDNFYIIDEFLVICLDLSYKDTTTAKICYKTIRDEDCYITIVRVKFKYEENTKIAYLSNIKWKNFLAINMPCYLFQKYENLFNGINLQINIGNNFCDNYYGSILLRIFNNLDYPNTEINCYANNIFTRIEANLWFRNSDTIQSEFVSTFLSELNFDHMHDKFQHNEGTKFLILQSYLCTNDHYGKRTDLFELMQKYFINLEVIIIYSLQNRKICVVHFNDSYYMGDENYVGKELFTELVENNRKHRR